MDNADKPLRFKLLPCPKCRAAMSAKKVMQLGENDWAVLHRCLNGQGETQFLCHGENLRMTVQKWNKYAREWKP